jgi:hypothetical protein
MGKVGSMDPETITTGSYKQLRKKKAPAAANATK